MQSKLLLQMAPAQILSVQGRQIFDSRGNPTVEVVVETYRGRFTASVPSGASTGTLEAVELRDGGSDYMGKGVTKAVDNVNEVIGPALVGKDPTDLVRLFRASSCAHAAPVSSLARLVSARQATLDMMMVKELDGSESEWGYTKGKLGANAILAVSIALCKAGAAQQDKPLYRYIADIAGAPRELTPLLYLLSCHDRCSFRWEPHVVLIERLGTAGVTEPTLPMPAFNIINGGSHAGNKLAMQEFMILPTGAESFSEAIKVRILSFV